MNKKIRAILCTLLVAIITVALTLVMVACDSNNNDNKGKGDSSVAVTGITLSESEITLEEGESATLTVTFIPADATDKTITWTTDDPDCATVENGVVTAGSDAADTTCTITATTANGKTATCDVIVIAGKGELITKTADVTAEKSGETLTHTNTLKMYTGGYIELSGQASILTALLPLDKDFTGTFQVRNNKLAINGSVVCYGFTLPTANKLTCNKEDKSLTIALYSNNGSLCPLGEYTFTREEANSLGFDMDNWVEIPVTSITWDNEVITTNQEGETITYSMNIVSGQSVDLMEAATFLPSETTTETFSSIKSDDTSVVSVGDTKLTGIVAGTTKVTVEIDDLKYEINVTVTYPVNPYESAVAFEQVKQFDVVLNYMGYVIPGKLVFFPDGTVYDGSTSMGYYTIEKDADVVTGIKYTMFSDNLPIELDVEINEGCMTSTYDIDQMGNNRVYTEVKFVGGFEEAVTFNIINPLDGQTVLGSLTFNADGTFSGVYMYIVPMAGVYNLADGSLTMLVNAPSAFSGSYAVTGEIGARSFVMIYFPMIESVKE